MATATVTIDTSHDPLLRSWVESANQAETDFPIQNLPWCRYRNTKDSGSDWKIGIGIGDKILDARSAGIIDVEDMNELMSACAQERVALRNRISKGLAEGSSQQAAWQPHLIEQQDAEMALPCRVHDYTDFYTSIHHATAIGRLFRPDQPLLPNYQWVPIGYHGRSSSLNVSGGEFPRPMGQTKAPDAAEPTFGPCRRLDYELELGFLIAKGNAQGHPIAIEEAEEYFFGVVLLNDWSARDIQAWEYQPLGPFLSKNFASTVSPWVITAEALAPFRMPFKRAENEPQPLKYLDGASNREHGHIAISLEVLIQTPQMLKNGEEPVPLSRCRYDQAAYWTIAQLISHHTVGGCNLQPGDLFGSGTLSGPQPSEAGSLIELTRGGKFAVTLPNGEQRTFVEDGDTLILQGWCEKQGAKRIGLGQARATVLASKS